MFTNNDWSNPKWAGPNSAGAGVPHLREPGNATVHTGPNIAGGGQPVVTVAVPVPSPGWHGMIVDGEVGTYTPFESLDAAVAAPGIVGYFAFAEYDEDMDVVAGIDTSRGIYGTVVMIFADDVSEEDSGWGYAIYGVGDRIETPLEESEATGPRGTVEDAIDASPFKPASFFW